MNPPSPEPMPGQAGRTTAVVLAAGLGTRMKSAEPKVLHPLCGRPMLAYVLDAWDEAAAGSRRGPTDRSIVYSPAAEAIRDVFGERADSRSRTSHGARATPSARRRRGP